MLFSFNLWYLGAYSFVNAFFFHKIWIDLVSKLGHFVYLLFSAYAGVSWFMILFVAYFQSPFIKLQFLTLRYVRFQKSFLQLCVNTENSATYLFHFFFAMNIIKIYSFNKINLKVMKFFENENNKTRKKMGRKQITAC